MAVFQRNAGLCLLGLLLTLAARIAEGDLQVRLEKASDEDIMGEAFQKIVDRLGLLLREVKSSARKVKLDSDQINSANQSLSEWTGNQAV